jgi:hypothetical protein
MSRLVRQVLATAALIAAMLLHDLAAVVEPVWAYVPASFGVWLAVATAVRLIVSAARPQRSDVPVMFAATPKLTPEQESELAAIVAKRARRGGGVR